MLKFEGKVFWTCPGPPLGVVFDNSELSNHDELSRVLLLVTKNLRVPKKKNPTRWYIHLGRVQTMIFIIENGAGPGRVQGRAVYNKVLVKKSEKFWTLYSGTARDRLKSATAVRPPKGPRIIILVQCRIFQKWSYGWIDHLKHYKWHMGGHCCTSWSSLPNSLPKLGVHYFFPMKNPTFQEKVGYFGYLEVC
jgi:hypothetical protein